MNTTNRWNTWMERARTCFKAAGAIDTSATVVATALRELEPVGANEEMVSALHEAEAALIRARDAVQAALKARQLTAANREPVYGLVG